MAPPRMRKRKSTASTTAPSSNDKDDARSETSQHSNIAAAMAKHVPQSTHTPPRGLVRKQRTLSHTQKQALMDNLQLEITERARKLRAQYTLQAQGLRTRLEIRVHRIPSALRRARIAALLEQHSQPQTVTRHDTTLGKTIQKTSAESIERDDVAPAAKTSASGTTSVRGLKRASDAIPEEGDKENASATNPKKRVKATVKQAPPAPSAAQHAAPQRVPTSQVLSPKSNNSRTIPRSPVKGTGIPSPMKSTAARLASPLKPSVVAGRNTSVFAKPINAAKPKTTAPRSTSRQDNSRNVKAANSRAKRAVATAAASSQFNPERTSNISDATDNSTGTTIVTKRTASRTNLAAGSARGAKAGVGAKFAGLSANGRKVAVTKVDKEPAGTVKGGRTLRKRA